MNEINELRERSRQLRTSRRAIRRSVKRILDLFGDGGNCAICGDKDLTNMHYKYNFYNDFGEEIFTNDENEIVGKTLNDHNAICLGGGDYRICEDIHTFVPKIQLPLDSDVKEEIPDRYNQTLVFTRGKIVYMKALATLAWKEVTDSEIKHLIDNDVFSKLIRQILEVNNNELKEYNRIKDIADKLANVINPEQLGEEIKP